MNSMKAKVKKMTLNKKLVITMEECGELVRACSKILRHGTKTEKYTQNLIEEIADVEAMLYIITKEFNFKSEDLEVLIEKRIDKMMKPEYE